MQEIFCVCVTVRLKNNMSSTSLRLSPETDSWVIESGVPDILYFHQISKWYQYPAYSWLEDCIWSAKFTAYDLNKIDKALTFLKTVLLGICIK